MTEKKKKTNKERIPWHPAFYAAAEFDLREYRETLFYEQECQLNKEPLRIDLLIIKKKKDVVIKNEFGHIFRGYNIIEYKSPDDALNIDDYFKTEAYACLYKTIGVQSQSISDDDITVSFFRESYPRKMIEALQEMGIAVIKKGTGIYVLEGKRIMFPTQIVVTKELNPETSPGMRVLSKKLGLKDLEIFFKAAENAKRPQDKINIDAIIHASGLANRETYQKARGVVPMSDFLRELMKDEIEKQLEDTKKEVRAEERDLCAELMGKLLEAGRIDDALRAAQNKAYLSQLIDEMCENKTSSSCKG